MPDTQKELIAWTAAEIAKVHGGQVATKATIEKLQTALFKILQITQGHHVLSSNASMRTALANIRRIASKAHGSIEPT